MTFAPRIDPWLGLVVLSAPVIAVGTAIALTLTEDTTAAAIGWGTVVAVVALYAGVVWPLEYELTDRELVIRFGLVRSLVPLEQVTRVHRTRNPLASPALSLRRLHIDRGRHGYALIAPADEAGFLRALSERAPHVELPERSPASD